MKEKPAPALSVKILNLLSVSPTLNTVSVVSPPVGYEYLWISHHTYGITAHEMPHNNPHLPHPLPLHHAKKTKNRHARLRPRNTHDPPALDSSHVKKTTKRPPPSAPSQPPPPTTTTTITNPSENPNPVPASSLLSIYPDRQTSDPRPPTSTNDFRSPHNLIITTSSSMVKRHGSANRRARVLASLRLERTRLDLYIYIRLCEAGGPRGAYDTLPSFPDRCGCHRCRNPRLCISLSLSLFLNFDARRMGFLILMREGREFFLFCLQK